MKMAATTRSGVLVSPAEHAEHMAEHYVGTIQCMDHLGSVYGPEYLMERDGRLQRLCDHLREHECQMMSEAAAAEWGRDFVGTVRQGSKSSGRGYPGTAANPYLPPQQPELEPEPEPEPKIDARRLTAAGFRQPTEAEFHGNGEWLVGRRLYVQGYGAGFVTGFGKLWGFGSSTHTIEFEGRSLGEQKVKLQSTCAKCEWCPTLSLCDRL